MKQTPAWLLNIGNGRFVATGERELLHLVEQPVLSEVPLAPRHCMRVLAWQGQQLIPVWDTLAWVEPEFVSDQILLVGIVAYQSRRRETPEFGALILTEPPKRVLVDDSQACALPDHPGWSEIALSCFLHQGEPVPILDLPRMFSRFIPPIN